ncbi:hypothetical protein L218DRAFT_950664 [Marasmius fiardii PR-910]|nr:hypothetical protein L218DRAFT_950664 [Marasmius fiardii PR-910]
MSNNTAPPVLFNPLTPLAFLDPQTAKSLEASRYSAVAALGIASGIFYIISTGCTSFLFLLRVVAVWNWNRWIVATFTFLRLATFGSIPLDRYTTLCQAPAQDITKHRVTGGYWKNPTSGKWEQARGVVLDYVAMSSLYHRLLVIQIFQGRTTRTMPAYNSDDYAWNTFKRVLHSGASLSAQNGDCQIKVGQVKEILSITSPSQPQRALVRFHNYMSCLKCQFLSPSSTNIVDPVNLLSTGPTILPKKAASYVCAQKSRRENAFGYKPELLALESAPFESSQIVKSHGYGCGHSHSNRSGQSQGGPNLVTLIRDGKTLLHCAGTTPFPETGNKTELSKRLVKHFDSYSSSVQNLGQELSEEWRARGTGQDEETDKKKEKVVIKVMHSVNADENTKRHFSKEGRIWDSIYNINCGKYILLFYGFGEGILVRRTTKRPITTRMIRGITEGLNMLMQPPIAWRHQAAFLRVGSEKGTFAGRVSVQFNNNNASEDRITSPRSAT